MWGGKTSVLPRVWGLWSAGVRGRRPLGCSAASVAGNNSPKCWKCGGPGGLMRGDGFFCPQCRALQPPDPTRDYFSLMDWYERRFQEMRRQRHVRGWRTSGEGRSCLGRRRRGPRELGVGPGRVGLWPVREEIEGWA